MSSCCSCTFADTGIITESCSSGFALFMSIVEMLILSRCEIADPCRRLGADAVAQPPRAEYDFVVIGAGVAGPVLASRLSEPRTLGKDPWRVLLLEAGPEEPTGTQVPAYAVAAVGTDLDWKYKTEPQEGACLSSGGICSWPRGKMVSGTGGMQGMMYTRGNRRIYDEWGIEDWSYDDVLPYFKLSENNKDEHLVEDEYHGFDGPLTVGQFPHRPQFSEVVVEAGRELGYYNQDVNGKNQTGFVVAQMMAERGLRASTPRMYIRPNRYRPNLGLTINAHVTKVIFEGQRAAGVEYEDKRGNRRIVYARKEVILSAGSIASPQILMLSGIGPKEHLAELGIPIVSDLPGVGKNLHNHVSVGVGFTINDTSYHTLTLEVLKEYLTEGKGPMSSTGLTQNTAFMLSKYAEPDFPDLQVFFDGFLADCSRTGQENECSGGQSGECGRRSIYARPTNILTESKGFLKLRSSDPLDPPLIYPEYLTSRKDLDILVDGIKMVLRLAETDAMKRWGIELDERKAEGCEGEEAGTDAYWECLVRRYTGPENHQGGTAKMGTEEDPEAVLDSRLRVRGVENLRVVDASIFPRVPNSNPIAAIIMSAEKASAYIKERWEGEEERERRKWLRHFYYVRDRK